MKKIVILGAAGRDFHLFNTCFRGRDEVRVVAFTAAQIPDIEGRSYPPELAGEGYPEGIPIAPEEQLSKLIREQGVDEAIFAYSDVSQEYIAEREELVRSAGAAFSTFDVDATMIRSTKPVVAICAVRTGCGKSQTTRRVAAILEGLGKKVAAVRHPMPYGDLLAQAVQRFGALEDLDRAQCTIEEREEYEPHIRRGGVVFAGVDFERILRRAEQEADVILWDGGNNDTPFYKPDIWITVVDPLRPGHELTHFPGTENFKRADLILFNKMDEARPEDVAVIEENLARLNPNATVVKADSRLELADPEAVRGKRVLCIEDGPTVTHGGMTKGAATVAAERNGAAELVDPRPFLQGKLRETFEIYPSIGHLLPAMGYGETQIRDLEATVNATDCDLVLIGTPIDLGAIIKIEKPSQRVSYELAEHEDGPTLAAYLEEHLKD